MAVAMAWAAGGFNGTHKRSSGSTAGKKTDEQIAAELEDRNKAAEAKEQAIETLRTIHANLVKMFTDVGVATESHMDIYFTRANNPHTITTFDDNSNFMLQTYAQITSDGLVAPHAFVYLGKAPNVEWGIQKLPYESVKLPINTYQPQPFLLEANSTPPADNGITSQIHMLVRGWRPIITFLHGERGWEHKITESKITSNDFTLTVLSTRGNLKTRNFTITGGTDDQNFTVAYQKTTKAGLSMDALKIEIKTYLDTPQNGIFARYTELTERADALIKYKHVVRSDYT